MDTERQPAATKPKKRRTRKRIRTINKPIGIVDENGTFFYEDGKVTDYPRVGSPIFMDRHAMMILRRSKQGEFYYRHNRPQRWRPKHHEHWARLVRVDFKGSPEDAIQSFVKYREWLESVGGELRDGITGSSLSVLKAHSRLYLYHAGDERAPNLSTVVGARIIDPPRPMHIFGKVCKYDMSSAYAYALSKQRYGKWVETQRITDNGYSEVTIRTDDNTFPVLPMRKRPENPILQRLIRTQYPRDFTMRGTWSNLEIMYAIEHGARVITRHRSWHNMGIRHPFHEWYWIMQDGRQLGGLPGLLAKISANSVWGIFAYTPGKYPAIIVDFPNKEPRKRLAPEHKVNKLQDYSLAELVSSKVRTRLHGFCSTAPHLVISAHTDGAWVLGNPFDTFHPWSLREQAYRLQILDAARYRFWRMNGTRQTIFSGAFEGEKSFDRIWSKVA